MKLTLSSLNILTSTLVVGLFAVGSVAHAQTEGAALPPPPAEGVPNAEGVPEVTSSTVPAALVARSVVLPNGTLEIRQAGFNINLSKGNVGKPLFLTIPNISFGVAENLEIGIASLQYSRFSPGPSLAAGPLGYAQGACLSSSASCGSHRFNSIAVEGLYKFLAGDFQMAGHALLNFAQISDPLWAQLALGVLGKYTSGNFALVFNPLVFLGLSNRDGGNKEALALPVSAQLQLQPQFALLVNTGIYGPFDHFGDFYSIPVGVGGFFNINPMVDVGATFSLLNVLGKTLPGEGRLDTRGLFLFVNIRPISI